MQKYLIFFILYDNIIKGGYKKMKREKIFTCVERTDGRMAKILKKEGR